MMTMNFFTFIVKSMTLGPGVQSLGWGQNFCTFTGAGD